MSNEHANGSEKSPDDLESLIAATQLDIRRIRSSVITVSASIEGFREQLQLARNDLGKRIKELNSEIQSLKDKVEQFEGDMSREIATRAREQAKGMSPDHKHMPASVIILLVVQTAIVALLAVLTLWPSP